jgi:hypothetical protein
VVWPGHTCGGRGERLHGGGRALEKRKGRSGGGGSLAAAGHGNNRHGARPGGGRRGREGVREREVSHLHLGMGKAESKVEVAAMESLNSCMVATFRTHVAH